MTDIVRLRITVLHPPAGVLHRMQRGKDGLVAPTRSSADALTFDFTVRLGEPFEDGSPRFLGEFTQGPPAKRFVYVNTGAAAGQHGTTWQRRAKIPLTSITAAQVRDALRDERAVLEAQYEGTGRDGGPTCASVKLIGGAWVLRRGK